MIQAVLLCNCMLDLIIVFNVWMEKLLITTGMAVILRVSYLIALNVKVDGTTIAKFVKMAFM